MSHHRSLYVTVSGLCLILSGNIAQAQVKSEAKAAKDEQALSVDEEAIRQSAVKFVEAYNAKKADAIADLFSPDARMEEEDGPVIEGREAIQEAFTEVFEDSPNAALSVEIDSLKFITPDVAVEEGSTEFFPDGETHTSSSRYIVAHLKKGGVWRMVSVRTLGQNVFSNYEYLRELEWMVGDWIDEGDDAVVESTFRFDDNKNFLLQNFQVRRAGEITVKGTQRIGWDRRRKQFRAWIFDSEGGFGEGQWVQVDDDWVIKSTGTTSEGESASGTRTLTLIDGDHVRVRMTDRFAGNERLPDFDFIMARKPPAPRDWAADP